MIKSTLKALVVVQFFYSIALANTDLSLYGYEQRVGISPVSNPTTVGVTLPMEVRQALNPKFSNLEVINARNESVPFELYDHPQGLVTEIDQLTVSSIKVNNNPTELVDNDPLTTFAFDEKVDGANASTVLVDFGQNRDLHQIAFRLPRKAVIRGIEIKMGTNADRLKTVRSKSAFNKVVDGTFPLARYVEISFFGPSVKLHDVLFYERPSAEVYFTAQPGMSYRVLSGNPVVKDFRFQSRLENPKNPTINAGLESVEFNRLATDDIDGDSVANDDDNCPFVKNKNQKDSDEDRIGDVCDNAKNQKNYDQSDVDLDGIGDIADNCKMRANPGQYDADKDGVGNECDVVAEGGIEDENDKSSNAESLLPFFLGLLVVFAVSGVAWWRFR